MGDCMSMLFLQYIWIENWKNLKKKGFNFSERYKFSFDSEGILAYESNTKKYVKNVFGENVDITAVVGQNGTGKTSIFEFLMRIFDKKTIPTNCIIVFCKSDNSLIAYHTGILKEFSDGIYEMNKDSDGKYYLNEEVVPNTVYYTSAFNYEQYNQEFNNIYNYSLANQFNKYSYSAKVKKDDFRKLTDINENHFQIIHNQLDFIHNHGEFFEKFGVRKPMKFDVYLKNSSNNALLDMVDQYYAEKKEAMEQIKIKSSFSDEASKIYQSYVDECERMESEFNIKLICEQFISDNSSINIEKNVNKIAVELMNSFISELKDYNKWFFDIMSSDSECFSFFRYINNIYTKTKEDNTGFVLLKRIKIFFESFKPFALKTSISFLSPPHENEELWHFWNTEKYTNFINFLVEFIEESDGYVNWDLDAHISIDIDNSEANEINAIRFYDEYAKIGKVNNFLSFSYGLSSGEMALLNMYSGLYEAISNIAVNRKNDKKPEHILLLIDEADMLFHPEWQQKYIDSLVNFMKMVSEGLYIQVFIATHSPIMLSDIPKQNILYLTDEFSIMPPETFCANIFQLFRYSFFLDESAIGSFAEKKLKDIICRIDTIDFKNGDNLHTEIESLQKEIGLIGDSFLRRKIEDRYYSKLANVRELSNANIIKKLQKKMDELQQQITKLKKEDGNE